MSDQQKTCPPHIWRTELSQYGTAVTYCHICGETWRDLMRGFNSNVQPSKSSSRGTIGNA